MDLKTLRERGAFVTSAPVPHEVSWTHDDGNGEPVTDTFTVHIVKHSAGSVERLRAEAAANPQHLWETLFLSESLRLGDDGSERLSYEDAFALNPDLARTLLRAISAVNRLGGDSEKN